MSVPHRPRNFRPAIFGCSATGCSRAFKSESALKRHQTALHVVPHALRPWHAPDLTQDANEDALLENTDTQPEPLDPYPLPQHQDGLHTERHPILDGECTIL